MKFLLDTHAFLWWIGNDDRLSSTARDTISDGCNQIFFSAASAWEMAIKTGSGKMSMQTDLAVFIKKHLHQNDFSVLPISLIHSLQIAQLAPHHRDPFDRMLVAQAQVEKMTLISKDAAVAKYTVDICW